MNDGKLEHGSTVKGKIQKTERSEMGGREVMETREVRRHKSMGLR